MNRYKTFIFSSSRLHPSWIRNLLFPSLHLSSSSSSSSSCSVLLLFLYWRCNQRKSIFSFFFPFLSLLLAKGVRPGESSTEKRVQCSTVQCSAVRYSSTEECSTEQDYKIASRIESSRAKRKRERNGKSLPMLSLLPLPSFPKGKGEPFKDERPTRHFLSPLYFSPSSFDTRKMRVAVAVAVYLLFRWDGTVVDNAALKERRRSRSRSRREWTSCVTPSIGLINRSNPPKTTTITLLHEPSSYPSPKYYGTSPVESSRAEPIEPLIDSVASLSLFTRKDKGQSGGWKSIAHMHLHSHTLNPGALSSSSS